MASKPRLGGSLGAVLTTSIGNQLWWHGNVYKINGAPVLKPPKLDTMSALHRWVDKYAKELNNDVRDSAPP